MTLDPRTLFRWENLPPDFPFSQTNLLEWLGTHLEATLRAYLKSCGVQDNVVNRGGKISPDARIEGPVLIAEGASIEAGALVQGPSYIGPGAVVRHGAFIRGMVYLGPEAVVGHTTEVKGSVFLPQAKAPHFAYVGDSVLGYQVNLGAGTKIANLRFDHGPVTFRHPETGEKIRTGLKKCGALLGDNAQTGCNSVLSPGTIVRSGKWVSPGVVARGTI